MKKTKIKKRRMSFSAVLFCLVFGAGLLAALYFSLRHIHMYFAPTVQNSERLLERGKPRDALAQLDKLTRTSRGDSRLLFLRGQALFNVLMEEFKNDQWGGYGLNPNNWLAHPLADEAEKCFLDAMAISPYNIEIRLALGNLYRQQGRFVEAEDILRSVLAIDNANAEAYLALGLLYAEGHRLPIAQRALYAAWELDRGNPRISKNMGLFYRFYVDEPELAILWFNRYLDADPRHDSDINFIRAELRDLYDRYPEFGVYDRDPPMANRGVGRTFTPRQRQR